MKHIKIVAEKLFSVLSMAVWAYLAVFYSFVIRATFILGFVPTYDNPDPKTLGFVSHTKFVILMFSISAISLIIGLATLIFLEVLGVTPKRKILISYWCGLAVMICHVLADPFIIWFAD